MERQARHSHQLKPFYEHGGITIYHGDCRQVLPQLERADLVCTDPPYNVGKDYGKHNDAMSEDDYGAWCKEVVAACLLVADNQFWVAPRYKLQMWEALLPKSHLVVIPRGAGGPLRAGWCDQFAIALAIGKPSPVIPDLWNGIRLKGEGYFFREETYDHPGYTPAPIMMKAITHLSTTSVIEPFCGTGTTLRCCKLLGRKCVGIELDEKWCEIAANSLSQEILLT